MPISTGSKRSRSSATKTLRADSSDTSCSADRPFQKRENAHKDQGMIKIRQCVGDLLDVGSVEREPAFEGDQIICRLTPKKKEVDRNKN